MMYKKVLFDGWSDIDFEVLISAVKSTVCTNK